MVFEAGLKKWREKQKLEQERKARDYSEHAVRIERASLAPLPKTDYQCAEAVTTRSWLLHRKLL